MITIGIDVGVLTVKGALLVHGEWNYYILEEPEESSQAAVRVMENLLIQRGLTRDQVDVVVATGSGKNAVEFAQKRQSDMLCHAKGANYLFPTARTVIDLGAEGCRVMRIDDTGMIEDFATNDKCASGTGMFLDLVANVLEVPVSEFGHLSLKTDKKAEISGKCAVFGESQVISHVHNGVPVEEILAGVHDSIALRTYEQVQRLGVNRDLVITGGVARNAGMVQALKEKTGVDVLVPEDPAVAGAVGAALLAQLGRGRRRQGVAR